MSIFIVSQKKGTVLTKTGQYGTSPHHTLPSTTSTLGIDVSTQTAACNGNGSE